MSGLTVLLIEPNGGQVASLRAALSRLPLVTVEARPGANDAVLWAAAHAPDLCLIADRLPDGDALATLARLRQRRPDLPAIILASRPTVPAAIAAFHAGVLDYVPKESGFQEVIYRLVDQVARRTPAERIDRATPTTGDLSAALLRPNYQNRLRVIGRQLDRHGYRSITVLEVAGGFLVRAVAPGQRVPEALEFPDRDLPHLMAEAIAARNESRPQTRPPLAPTGYEDLLRTLGEQFDEQGVEAVSIAELDVVVAIGGVSRVEEAAGTRLSPFHRLLREPEIDLLLTEAERRREWGSSATSRISRLLGRRSA